jgi:hypothetical protein
MHFFQATKKNKAGILKTEAGLNPVKYKWEFVAGWLAS